MFVATLLMVSLAFAFFIVCPRMAGMVYAIVKATNTNMLLVGVIGTVISLPLVLAMIFIFQRWGVLGALGFAVLTDLAAALLMGKLDFKAGVEVFIIALFLILGVRVASLVSSHLPG